MKHVFARRLILFTTCCLWLCGTAQAAKLTALDRYVAKPDTNYSYRLVSTIPGAGATTFVLEMKSQAWLTTQEVNQPVWQHWLTII